jgi:hypothetical protein
VYFSRHAESLTDDSRKKSLRKRFGITNGNRRSYPILGGRLHFVKFETSKLNECLDFISSKQLHRGGMLKTNKIIDFHQIFFFFVYFSYVIVKQLLFNFIKLFGWLYPTNIAKRFLFFTA